MTEVPPASGNVGDAGGNLGVFRGVLQITEPNGEQRLVEFEAPVGSAHMTVNGQPMPNPS
jgi:hypothetical protein